MDGDGKGGDLASNPAVLQVNLRHLRSSPSSDMVFELELMTD